MGSEETRLDAHEQETRRRTAEARERLLSDSALMAVPLNIIVAGVLCVFLAGTMPVELLAGWFAAMGVAATGRFGIVWRARRAGKPVSAHGRFFYGALTATVGGLWGATPFLAAADAPPMALYACALIIPGISAAAAITSAADSRMVTAYTLPSLGLFTAWLAMQGSFHGYLLAGICAIYFFVLQRLTRNYARMLTEAVEANVYLEEAKRKTEAQTGALAELAEQHDAAARSAAEQARANAAVLANMSHEFGAPLNGVLGMAQLLEESGLDGEQARMVRRIRSSGEMLSRLVSDILDVSRIEAGRMELVLDDLTGEALAERIERVGRPIVDARGLDLKVEIAGEPELTLRADEGRLVQMLRIYVENVAAATETGKVCVRLHVERDGGGEGRLRAEVGDSAYCDCEAETEAAPIAPSEVEPDIADREAGAGLGLHLVTRLAGLMNGAAERRRTTDGKGAVLTFEAHARLSSRADRYSDAERLTFGSRRLRILVGESDKARQSVLHGYLKSFNCAVACAADRVGLEEALNAAAYDAVVLGLSLDDCEPEDALAEIRAMASTASLTPVVRLSAELDEAVRAGGGETLMRSPVTGDAMREALSRALADDPAASRQLRKVG
jgi:signal transduction histidine kinase